MAIYNEKFDDTSNKLPINVALEIAQNIHNFKDSLALQCITVTIQIGKFRNPIQNQLKCTLEEEITHLTQASQKIIQWATSNVILTHKIQKPSPLKTFPLLPSDSRHMPPISVDSFFSTDGNVYMSDEIIESALINYFIER